MDLVASSSQPFSSQEGGVLVNEERQEYSRDKAKKMGTKQKKERSRATEKERSKDPEKEYRHEAGTNDHRPDSLRLTCRLLGSYSR